MFEDIRALIEFVDAGSIARAANRLHRTPSAITRQLQRLEAELGGELLDRSVKPPRLTPLGVRIAEQSRDVLKRVGDLKALAAIDTEPAGLLRIGIAHALADGALVAPVQALTKRFPKLRLRVFTDVTGRLIPKVQAGELDLAAVFLPESRVAPRPLITNVIAKDRMVIVEKNSRGSRARTWHTLAALPWVLNPPECLLRSALVSALEKTGAPAMIAAEVHNMHLQLAFIEAGHGLGFLPAGFVRRYGRGAVRVVTPKDFELQMSIAIVRAGPLGSLEAAATEFSDNLEIALAH